MQTGPQPGPDEPGQDATEPFPTAGATRSRRRAAVAGGTGLALVLSLIGGAMVLLFSGDTAEKPTALNPVTTTPSAPAPKDTERPDDGGDLLDFTGGLSAQGLPSGSGTVTSSDDSSGMLAAAPGFTPGPAGALPALPALTAPPLPAELPGVAPVDWNAVVAPFLAAQNANTALNTTGSILGTSIGAAAAVAAAAGDLALFLAVVDNGQGALNQLQASLAAAPAAAAVAQSLPPPPDLSGLSAAFAAAAAAPPLGVQAPALPPLPPPPALPKPEEALGALLALPAAAAVLPALPPPPPLGLPGLPPPPPFGLPGLPPPPPFGLPPPPAIGLPPIGLPSFGLPSITRLMGLPF